MMHKEQVKGTINKDHNRTTSTMLPEAGEEILEEEEGAEGEEPPMVSNEHSFVHSTERVRTTELRGVLKRSK